MRFWNFWCGVIIVAVVVRLAWVWWLCGVGYLGCLLFCYGVDLAGFWCLVLVLRVVAAGFWCFGLVICS